jgi:serine protease AprX
MNLLASTRLRRKAVWGPRRTLGIALAAILGLTAPAWAAGTPGHAAPHGAVAGPHVPAPKLDNTLTNRANNGNPANLTPVIVTLVPGAPLPAEFRPFARPGKLDIINSYVLDLPNGLLKRVASSPNVLTAHFDRPTKAHNYRTRVTVGAKAVQDTLGYTGAGVTIAVIDSGIATWHDDLTNNSATVYPYGNQRVAKFVDFVNGRTTPYDDNGHGTHVAGTIAGNGYDSNGEKSGMAPGASLVALKVLDANGRGTISQMIAAMNWVAANYQTYNIRVVNMSVGARILESFWSDPLTLAAKALTDRGITVVTAAGNFGKNSAGALQYGGITAPGNAPWVLTVGASSTMGTLTRADDTMADYSSSGPTAIDFIAKPDLVAPGTGTISLASPGSYLYTTNAQFLMDGRTVQLVKPYLALSGTSMATPVVSGTIALMLQANPALTPNLIKAILQYTAQVYPGYSPLREGAGFLNTLGAVKLAQYYASGAVGKRMPVQNIWSQHIIWGNHQLTGGYIDPTANAWANNIVWGSALTRGDTGDNVVWGTACGLCANIVWSTAIGLDNIVWGTAFGADNIVWGTACADNTCDNIVWGTALGDDNIVWGTDCGGGDCDNVVWGTFDRLDNIVWGTALATDNIVWGTALGADNIVWGTALDTTWGSDATDSTVYSDDATDPLPSIDIEFGIVTTVDGTTSLSLGGL